jgi:hypothetical protein
MPMSADGNPVRGNAMHPLRCPCAVAVIELVTAGGSCGSTLLTDGSPVDQACGPNMHAVCVLLLSVSSIPQSIDG